MTPPIQNLIILGSREVQPTKQEIGAKALNLHLAKTWRFDVPPGIALPASSFGSSAAIPADLMESLPSALAALGTGPYAVRSSGVLEDGAENSFAGQYVTTLNVNLHGLETAILACLQSANAAQIKAYHEQGVGTISVLIQQMVDPDVAGVAFSANPVTGERNEVVIEAVNGLGDKLVAGEVSPESILWRSAEIKRKGNRIVALSETMITKIAETAKALEAKFGAPQDIEWAFSKGKFYLLQSRPITALPIAPIPMEVTIPEGTWTRDDHHTVPTPIAWGVFFGPYGEAMTESFKSMGLNVQGLKFSLIGGHVYSQMKMDGGAGSKVPPSWVLWLVSRLLPSMRKMNAKAESLFATKSYRAPLRRWEEVDRQWMEDELPKWSILGLEDLTDDALLQRFESVRAMCLRGLQVHAGLGMAGFSCIAAFAIFCKDHLDWSYAKTLHVLSGNSPATTAHLLEAEAICSKYFCPSTLKEFSGDQASYQRILQSFPDFAEAVNRWNQRHGLRMTDYDVHNPTWGESPAYMDQLMREQLLNVKNGTLLSNSLKTEDSQEIDQARKTLVGLEVLSEFEDLLDWARKAYAVRDANGIETISKPFGCLRLHLLEIGRRIPELPGGPEDMAMLAPEEIAPALRRQLPDLKAIVLKRRAERQWAMFNRGPKRYGPAEPPMPDTKPFPTGLRKLFTLLGFMVEMEMNAAEAVVQSSQANAVQGVGVFAGKYTGVARLVKSPSEFSRIQPGEILVCRITSGEWSLIFSRIGALVTEEGGFLSHPAIIAREFGLPAVVAAQDAMQKIKDGQVITVDGATGCVHWE